MTLPAPLRTSAAHVFVADLAAPQLDDRDHHHLARVLRLREGQPVTVSDGRGRWCQAVWRADGVVADGVVHDAAPGHRLTIAAAVPKGDRLEWMVQKLTEVGVGEICLVECARSVVRWKADRAATQRARLDRIARDAAMQSRRVWLPDVRGPVPVADVLARDDVVVADPDGTPIERLAARPAAVVIGPEGGWDPAETAEIRRVSLGDHVLRVETAAVVAAVLAGSHGDVGWR